ncbi:MAG: two-component regulator propeller domain-containing protein [Saprospiraceae bacterium]
MPTTKKYAQALLLAQLLWQLLAARPLAAQNFRFEQFSTSNGLSNNTVYSIAQDRRGFIWVGTRDGLNRFDGYRFQVFKNEQGNRHSLSYNQINALLEDSRGKLWVGTHDGINVFDPATEQFQRFRHDSTDAGSIRSNLIYCFHEDENGDVWAGTNTKLEKFERATGKFKHFDAPPVRPDAPDEPRVHRITEFGGDLFLAMWGAGIWRFNKKTGELRRILTDDERLNGPGWVANIWAEPRQATVWAVINGSLVKFDAAQNIFRLKIRHPDVAVQPGKIDVAVRFSEGKMLLGTLRTGLKIWDENDGSMKAYLPNPSPVDEWANSISGIFKDRSGQFWLTTGSDGLIKFDPNPKPFETFQVLEKGKNGSSAVSISNISGLLETADGEIWAASRTHGLKILDAGRQGFSSVKNRPGVPEFFRETTANVVVQDQKGRFWIGSWGLGYAVWDPKTGDWHRFFYAGNDQTLVQQNSVARILAASDGTIWVGTYRGVFRISVDESQPVFAKKFKFENLDALGCHEDYVGTMAEDHLGNLWLGALNGGLRRFNPQTRQLRVFRHDADDPQSLGGRHVSSIFEDREHRIWVGTSSGGLNLFQPETEGFVKFRAKNGLPSDAVAGIVEDAQGFLWVTTPRGLSRFDPAQNTFLNYFKTDGLPCETFTSASIGISRRTGQVFAGGKDGFVIFHPDSIRRSDFVPQVAISGLTKYVVEGEQVRAVEVAGIAAAERIELPFSENTLAFEFASLDFRQPSKNQFAYRLEGMGNQWIQLGTRRTVTFCQLSPGKYVLRVRGSNHDGVWNEAGARLEIVILPPWWATWWAFLLYFFTAGGVLFAFARLQTRRRADRAEAERQRILNEAKSEFLSTVSHELRTPLTSILGFSKIIKKRLEERILPKTDLSDAKTSRAAEQVIENLNIVVSESERLTTLINEVLDLAKIESGKVVWHEERLEIGEIVARAAAATTTIFEHKNLDLKIDLAPNLPSTLGDADRLQQVLVNLLSNAVKFTQRGGVTVSARLESDERTLRVGVADTGIGIPEAFRQEVFEKFKQGADDTLTDKPQGTGLGLPICKEIVEHHGGRIWLESRVGEGSVFWFTLPVR